MINFKNLSKALKGSDRVYWFKEDGKEYVCDGNLLLSTETGVTGSGPTALVKLFGTVIQDGEGLVWDNYGKSKTINEMDKGSKDNLKSLFKNDYKYTIKDTNLLRNESVYVTKIFVSDTFYSFYQTKYTDLINKDCTYTAETSANVNPAKFTFNNSDILILMPVIQNDRLGYLKEFNSKGASNSFS